VEESEGGSTEAIDVDVKVEGGSTEAIDVDVKAEGGLMEAMDVKADVKAEGATAGNGANLRDGKLKDDIEVPDVPNLPNNSNMVKVHKFYNDKDSCWKKDCKKSSYDGQDLPVGWTKLTVTNKGKTEKTFFKSPDPDRLVFESLKAATMYVDLQEGRVQPRLAVFVDAGVAVLPGWGAVKAEKGTETYYYDPRAAMVG